MDLDRLRKLAGLETDSIVSPSQINEVVETTEELVNEDDTTTKDSDENLSE